MITMAINSLNYLLSCAISSLSFYGLTCLHSFMRTGDAVYAFTDKLFAQLQFLPIFYPNILPLFCQFFSKKPNLLPTFCQIFCQLSSHLLPIFCPYQFPKTLTTWYFFLALNAILSNFWTRKLNMTDWRT